MSFPRYPKYKPSGVPWLGEVPETWDLVTSKRLFFRRKNLNHGMACENRLALTLGGVIPRDLDDLDGLQASEFETYQVFEKDDLAFKLIDLQNIKTSRVGIVPEMGIMSPAYIRLEPQRRRVVPKFAYWFFTNLYNLCVFNELGGGVRQTLGPEELLQLLFVSPSIEEQTKIASFLDRETSKIDGLVGEQRRLIELLKEKRQAVISHAVTRGLNPHAPLKPSGIEWLGDVPKHWDVTPIGHLCDSISYGFTNPMPTTDEGPFLLTANDVDYGNVKYETARRTSYEAFQNDLTEKSRPKKDDVLITKDGTLGRVALHDGQEACINQSVASLRVKPNSVLPQFMATCLLGGIYQGRMIYDAGGTTIKHIYISRLAKMPIAYPSPSEQEEVLAFLREELAKLDALTAEAERAIELLQERRTALISAAVTGKIDVRSLGIVDGAERDEIVLAL